MWGVGAMQMHEIRYRRQVYKVVVEVLSNYKKSYFWWYGNPACGDATGSNRIETDWALVPPRPVWGKSGKGVLWFSVERFRMIRLMMVMFLPYSHMVSVVLVFSWVVSVLRSKYGTESQKVCCIVSGKWDVNIVTLQEFNIRYKLLWDRQLYDLTMV